MSIQETKTESASFWIVCGAVCSGVFVSYAAAGALSGGNVVAVASAFGFATISALVTVCACIQNR